MNEAQKQRLRELTETHPAANRWEKELTQLVRVALDQVVELEKRIENALARANGRFCEWGERAEMVEAILRGEEEPDV